MTRKEYRQKYLEKGICIDCGKRPIDFPNSKSRCRFCLDRTRRQISKILGKNLTRKQIADKKYCQKLRIKALEKLVELKSIPMQCSRCGLSDIKLLTINHLNGDGKTERNKTCSKSFYLKILRGQRTVKDLSILCKVCNWVDFYERTTNYKWMITFSV